MDRRFLFAAAVLSAGVIGGGLLVQRGLLAAPRRTPSTLFREVFERVRLDYVDTLSDSVLYARSAAGAVAELNDPGSALLTTDRLARLDEATAGTYVGVGVEVDHRAGLMTIVSVLPRSPAAAAGVRAGDRLVSIDGKTTLGLSPDDVSNALHGAAGTPVRLTLEMTGVDSLTHRTLIRRKIIVQSVNQSASLQNGIGYLALSVFSEHTGAELARAIDSLAHGNMQALIIDLRGNPGGLLEQGVAVADLFLRPGQLAVAMRGRVPESNRTFVDHAAPRWPALPLAVLVDSNSASAAEIVAGAWQDHDRAVVVGTPTYGKGSAQEVFTLPASGGRDAVKLTIGRWFTPSGRSINKPHTGGTSSDSLAAHPSDKIYRTDAGRPIRGAGGIQPDVVVTATSGPAAVVSSLDKDPAVETAVQLLAGARNQQDVFTRVAAKVLGRRP